MSAISWCDESFSPWFGCSDVSDGCRNCYAREWTLRHGKAGWGPHAERVSPAASAWAKPLAWNRKAQRLGRPLFVFGHVNGDPFDNKALPAQPDRLWQAIRATPALIWLLLTKRPQNIRRMLPADWGDGYANTWLGVTAENQREADRRLPLLCRTPAARRFVSAEPLLEEVALSRWLDSVAWVIAGCESAPGKRPGARHTDPAWIRLLRDQCTAAGTAFWLKQLVVDRKLVELPELDGKVWAQRPAP